MAPSHARPQGPNHLTWSGVVQVLDLNPLTVAPNTACQVEPCHRKRAARREHGVDAVETVRQYASHAVLEGIGAAIAPSEREVAITVAAQDEAFAIVVMCLTYCQHRQAKRSATVFVIDNPFVVTN